MEMSNHCRRLLALLRRRKLKGVTTGEARALLHIGEVPARMGELRDWHGIDWERELVEVPVPENDTGVAKVARYWLKDTLNNRRRFKKLDAAAKVSQRKLLKKAA